MIAEAERGILKLRESFGSDAEYDSYNCMSYSKLKDIYDNPSLLFEEREQSDSEWLVFGSLVDTMLTDEEHLWDRFLVNDYVPSEQFKKISEYMVANNISLDELTDDLVERIYTESGSSVNWTIATKKAKILSECSKYIDILKSSNGKMVISSGTYEEAMKIATVFKESPYTRHLFLDEKEQKRDNVEILYQYKIKYIYEGVQCKSKIDIVVINHNDRVISLYDIKTGSDYPRSFIRSALYKYKYGYQASLYVEGMNSFLEDIPGLNKYLVDDFRFVYVSRTKPDYPVILKLNDFCHKEFLVTGIYNQYYNIPALEEVFTAVSFYLKQVDSGETPVIPMDLADNDCEVEVGTFSRFIEKRRELAF